MRITRKQAAHIAQQMHVDDTAVGAPTVNAPDDHAAVAAPTEGTSEAVEGRAASMERTPLTGTSSNGSVEKEVLGKGEGGE